MTEWIRIRGDRFVVHDRPVRLKGTNFQTWKTPWRVLEAYDTGVIDGALDDAAALGCNCVRIYVAVDRQDEQERFADFVDRASGRGIRPYPCLSWGGSTFGMPDLDAMLQRRHFDGLTRFAARWKGDPRIFAWDLINEPDWCSDEKWQWAMEPAAAEVCIDWLIAAVRAVRAADPDHPVSVGLIFNYSWWTPAPAVRVVDAVDFVDFHYYHRTYKDRPLAEAIREVKARTGKPILVGEFGNSSEASYSTEGERAHSERIQGEVYRGYARDLASEPVAGCIQWTLHDYVDQPREHGENHYGILRGDRSLKPAAVVYRDEIPADPLG